MVLELSTALAMRCPTCGRLNIDQLNIFQLSGDTRHKIFCECGSHKMTVSKKGADHIVVEYYCIICDHEHSAMLSANKFWSKNHLSSLVCLETKLNLGYYGPYMLINEKLEKQQEDLNSMADELGYDDFSDPELILAILDYLHDIAANGGLFCECGSHDISIDLSSEKVKLICNNCQATYVVPVSSRKDLDRLKKLDELVLDLQAGTTKNPKGPWINI